MDGIKLPSYQSSITDQYADYNPKNIAVLSLVAMIKTVAQMKNARRGHDTQGRVKKVRLDSSNEGYSNYMAPMRMQRIARQSNDTDTYTNKILRPETDTYLTPEWDEFVPFPCSKSSIPYPNLSFP